MFFLEKSTCQIIYYFQQLSINNLFNSLSAIT